MNLLFLFILHLFNIINSFALYTHILHKPHKIVLTVVNSANENASIMDSPTLNSSMNDIGSVVQELISLCSYNSLNTFNSEENVKIESLINFLESKFSPIMTTPFLNLALSGEWNLLYSNTATKTEYKNLELNITQVLTPLTSDSFNGSLVNNIVWRLKNSVDFIIGTGDFIVKSNYTVTPKGSLEVRLYEHILKPVIVPDDIEALVVSIQRSVPIELFDPDETIFYNTYVDPKLRITRVVGGKWSKVNIFVKS